MNSTPEQATGAVQTYRVTGMTCAHCEAAVRAEVEQIGGVDALVVDASAGRLDVTVSAPIDDALIVAAVDEAGYEAQRA